MNLNKKEEGKLEQIPDSEQVVVKVDNEVPKKLDKIEKDDKQSFEDFKNLYKGVIDMKCNQDYGTIEDKDLWEDCAKELFLKSKTYLLKGNEYKAEPIQKKTENKKVESVKEYNTIPEIKERLREINKQLSYIKRRDAVSLSIGTEEEQEELYSERAKLNGKLRKLRNDAVNMDKLNPSDQAKLKDRLKDLHLWDGKDDTLQSALQSYRNHYIQQFENKKVEDLTYVNDDYKEVKKLPEQYEDNLNKIVSQYFEGLNYTITKYNYNNDYIVVIKTDDEIIYLNYRNDRVFANKFPGFKDFEQNSINLENIQALSDQIFNIDNPYITELLKTESKDNLQIRKYPDEEEFKGVWGLYDIKQNKFLQKGPKYLMKAALNDFNKKSNKLESNSNDYKAGDIVDILGSYGKWLNSSDRIKYVIDRPATKEEIEGIWDIDTPCYIVKTIGMTDDTKFLNGTSKQPITRLRPAIYKSKQHKMNEGTINDNATILEALVDFLNDNNITADNIVKNKDLVEKYLSDNKLGISAYIPTIYKVAKDDYGTIGRIIFYRSKNEWGFNTSSIVIESNKINESFDLDLIEKNIKGKRLSDAARYLGALVNGDRNSFEIQGSELVSKLDNKDKVKCVVEDNDTIKSIVKDFTHLTDKTESLNKTCKNESYYIKLFNKDNTDIDTIEASTEQEAIKTAEEKMKEGWRAVVYNADNKEALYDYDPFENNEVYNESKERDLSKYSNFEPSKRDLEKMKYYYSKNSNPNQVASSIKNLDKCLSRFFIAEVLNWKSCSQALYERAIDLALDEGGFPYEDEVREVLGSLKVQAKSYKMDDVYKVDTLSDDKSISTMRRYFSKTLDVLTKYKIPFQLNNRKPTSSERYMDGRNGRRWTIAYDLVMKMPNGKEVTVQIANHTNEGGGSYGVCYFGQDYNQTQLASIIESTIKENLSNEKIEENKLQENNTDLEYKYMLLDRLKQDCEYFLGNGNGNVEHSLWAKDIDEQIEKMKEIYNSFSEEEKPDWITLEDINNYEKRMKEYNKDVKTEDLSDKDKFLAHILNGVVKDIQSRFDVEAVAEFTEDEDEIVIYIRGNTLDLIDATSYLAKTIRRDDVDFEFDENITDNTIKCYIAPKNLDESKVEESVVSDYTLSEIKKVIDSIGDDFNLKISNADIDVETKTLSIDREDLISIYNTLGGNKDELTESRPDKDRARAAAFAGSRRRLQLPAKGLNEEAEIIEYLEKCKNQIDIMNVNEAIKNTELRNKLLTTGFDFAKGVNIVDDHIDEFKNVMIKATQDYFQTIKTESKEGYQDKCCMCRTSNLNGCYSVLDEEGNVGSVCVDCGKKYSLPEIEKKINSDMKSESKVNLKEDQYEYNRRKGRPNVKKIAEAEYYDNQDYYDKNIHKYKDMDEFIYEEIADIVFEYNLKEKPAEEVCQLVYLMAMKRI